MNQEKTRIVDLTRDVTFSFLGFDYRRVKTRHGLWGGALHTEDQVKNCPVEETQGSIS